MYKIQKLVLFSILLNLSLAAIGQETAIDRIRVAAATNPFRIWHDNTGKHQTVAKYISHDELGVTILKHNDLVLIVPLERLSERDREYVQQIAAGENPIKTLANKTLQFDKTNRSSKKDNEGLESIASANFEVMQIDIPAYRQEQIATLGLSKPLADRDLKQVQATLDLLVQSWPEKPSAKLIQAIADCTQTGNFLVDEKALELLLSTNPRPHIEVFTNAARRVEFNLRMLGYQGLSAINDERSLAVLVNRFESDDVRFIGKLLPSFGSRAERPLHEQLNNGSLEHVLVACSVLGEIGTPISIQPLLDLQNSSSKIAIQTQAKASMKKIQAREESSRIEFE